MKNKKLPNLISILILTLITVVMWITLNIYRAISNEPTPSVPNEISAPLTPDLDKDTIKTIESKIFLDESQIPFSSATPTSIASPEATIAPNQSTQSGSQP